jgi:DNA-binding transcriptional LysR family regulator
MTTEQLKYFISIAEKGSYSVTADEMHISQSSVSKQIRTFEWELGCDLFDRGPRHVRLTEAGAKLYPMLKSLLEQYEAVIREARIISTGQNDNVGTAENEQNR